MRSDVSQILFHSWVTNYSSSSPITIIVCSLTSMRYRKLDNLCVCTLDILYTFGGLFI